MIIGRKKELDTIKAAYESEYSEFVAVYGRRRVGKTFLVLESFKYKLTFQHAGLAKSKMGKQLAAWKSSLRDAGLNVKAAPKDWLEAFDLLKELIRQSTDKKKVIFIDEMPWMDTAKSGFVSALEHFWNGWACGRKDILLIICGSATSWIINNVIKNHGGLHNRVTYKIHVHQFTLRECEEYSKSLNLGFTRRQILECYMVLGGIPFYWKQLKREQSVAQNIDRLFFGRDADLSGEFDELYYSLFRNPEPYIKVVTTLAQKKIGMTLEELTSNGHIVNNGNLTKVLDDLEYCGFIRKYKQLGYKSNYAIYQLTDFYTLFYFKFICNNEYQDNNYWTHIIGRPEYNTWCGLSFEMVSMMHVDQIKRALQIGGVMSSEHSWRSKTNKRTGNATGAQIDLLIDRYDDVIDVCEMKYYEKEVVLDETEADKIRNRVLRLREESETEKAIHVILVTTKGLKRNEYSDIIQNTIDMDDLFT